MRTFKAIHQTTVKKEKVKFVKRDLARRVYGVDVLTYVCTFYIPEPTSPDHLFAKYTQPPGEYFGALIQGTRGGQTFGKHELPKYFATEKERDEYVTGRIDEFKRRSLA